MRTRSTSAIFVAFHNPIRNPIFTAVAEFALLAFKTNKTLQNEVEPLPQRCVRQGDPLSCDLFNFEMVSVVRKARVHFEEWVWATPPALCFNFEVVSVVRKVGVHGNDTMFRKLVQIAVCTDDIDIITNVLGVFMGLAIDKNKNKYVLSTIGEMRRIGSRILAANNSFKDVNEFCLPLLNLEIKRGVTLAEGFTMVIVRNWVEEASLVWQNFYFRFLQDVEKRTSMTILKELFCRSVFPIGENLHEVEV